MASSSSTSLPKHYLRILRAWPKDALRSVTFHAAMRRRLDYTFLGKASGANTSTTSPSAPPSPPRPINEEREAGQINALYSLLENRYSKQYPVSERMMHPASNPNYYRALAAEMEAVPTRSWLMNKWLRLKGLVRFT